MGGVALTAATLGMTPSSKAERDDAIVAALFAHDGMERLVREDGMPREAVEPEPVGFLAALEGLGYTVEPLDVPLREAAQAVIDAWDDLLLDVVAENGEQETLYPEDTVDLADAILALRAPLRHPR